MCYFAVTSHWEQLYFFCIILESLPECSNTITEQINKFSDMKGLLHLSKILYHCVFALRKQLLLSVTAKHLGVEVGGTLDYLNQKNCDNQLANKLNYVSISWKMYPTNKRFYPDFCFWRKSCFSVVKIIIRVNVSLTVVNRPWIAENMSKLQFGFVLLIARLHCKNSWALGLHCLTSFHEGLITSESDNRKVNA